MIAFQLVHFQVDSVYALFFVSQNPTGVWVRFLEQLENFQNIKHE
jgi:hypothetical protein